MSAYCACQARCPALPQKLVDPCVDVTRCNRRGILKHQRGVNRPLGLPRNVNRSTVGFACIGRQLDRNNSSRLLARLDLRSANSHFCHFDSCLAAAFSNERRRLRQLRVCESIKRLAIRGALDATTAEPRHISFWVRFRIGTG